MDNMELYWSAVSLAAGILIIIITGLLLNRFIKPYLPPGRRARLTGAAYACVMLILKLCPYELDSMTAYAAGAAVALAVMYAVDRRKLEQKLFLAVTFYLLEWISGGAAGILRSLLHDLFLINPAVVSGPALQLGCFIVVELIYIGLICFVMLLLVRVINRAYVYKDENMTRKELALMLAPSFSVLAGYRVFHFFSDAYETDLQQYIWNVHTQYSLLMTVYQIISFTAILTVIISYQRIKESQRKEREYAVLSGQMEEIKNHISQVEALYGDIRGLKHDMANHVMTLEHLFMKHERSGAERYLTRLKGELDKVSPGISSGNPVTDLILTQKQKEAGKRGISFACSFYFPKGIAIDAFDISVILNNGITNALEGAAGCEEPYISVSSYRIKNAYLIEIRNSFMGKIRTSRESGLPESSKEDRKNHGFGLANMRRVAQRYFGDIDVSWEEHEFILNVMLMTEK